MPRVLFLLLLLLLSGPALLLAQPDGELTIALPNDPTSLYIANASDVTAISATRPLYDSLLWYGPDGELLPGLAESWEISADGRTYTFRLREGVKFHNGEDFNAHSVRTIWEAGITPTNQYVSYYDSVASAEDIVALDDYTVQITTTEVDALFLGDVVEGWFALPPAYLAEVGLQGFEAAPVGTGPFMLEEWTPGDRIVMRAFEDYWNPQQPNVERVTFRVIPDAATRMAAIQTGAVDIVSRLNVDDVALLQSNPEVRVLSYPNDRVYYVAFKNVDSGVGTPLQDLRVRQALNLAVDREGILDGLFNGEGRLVSGLIVPGNLGHDPALAPWPHDPQRARELLAAAGHADGFAISMGCPADAYPNINEVCLAIQRDLAAVGVDVELEFRTSNTYWSQPQYGAVGPMFIEGWSIPSSEPFPRLEGSLTPGYYYTVWNDESNVAALERIRRTVDREQRAALYAELVRRLHEDPPFLYLYTLNIFEATSAQVSGYQPYASETFHLNDVGLQ